MNPRTTTERLAVAIMAALIILGVIAAMVLSAPRAIATGDHHPPKDCTYFPQAPGCEEPPPLECEDGEVEQDGECVPAPDPCVVDPTAPGCEPVEPEPCTDPATWGPECEPTTEPPAPTKPETDVFTPEVSKNPPSKGPKREAKTDSGCGWSRTVHPNGKVTWGDGYDCSEVKEEGF